MDSFYLQRKVSGRIVKGWTCVKKQRIKDWQWQGRIDETGWHRFMIQYMFYQLISSFKRGCIADEAA